MKERLTRALVHAIAHATTLDLDQIGDALETPRNADFGDLAFPCFALAKIWKEPPPVCAKRLAESILLPQGFSEALATGPFLNFRYDRPRFIVELVQSILNHQNESPASTTNSEKTVLVEYSSPNIAKPFHVGHLRATLIGNCLDRVSRYLGYRTISINHLGDWGTQFGFVWAGCELWGRPENPTVRELVEIYRRATGLKVAQERQEVAEADRSFPDINEMARRYFIDLEQGQVYAVEFWEWCRKISLEYLVQTYQRLNVRFDHYIGESFYSDRLAEVQDELERSGLLVESQGALGVDLGEELGFARIFTPDGRSLYLTRDLATAEYRAATHNFDKALYVVGAPQTLHFNQLKGILRALRKEYSDRIVHVAFGHVLGMKTRGEGEFIELNDFLDEAYERSLLAYHEQVTKRPEGTDDKEVARGVALAAIVFSNLARTRLKDVHFVWEYALEFQGDSGPYLLYAFARINSIREKAAAAGITPATELDSSLLSDASAFQLAAALAEFDHALERTFDESEPSHLANYALELARTFSKAYLELKVIGEALPLSRARLALFVAVQQRLGTSLELLGIPRLDRM